ncbi:MAG: patatin-like phospholipase family protein [Acidobacteriaceae bacterium]|jgi:NTE family protein
MSQGSKRHPAAPAMLLLLAVTIALHAQEPRQKIGLVLEGGGALGLAHIGVLQWLYQHHVPVDLVAGTSMGGLVGGIYATGRSPEQIQELIQNVDWDQALSGELPFRDLSYRRKEDEVQFPTRIEFGLRKGIQLPAGFNSGQQVSFILDHVALPYSQIKSFNDLPTPFACVATELNDGKQHVFHDGSLSLALRATMSLPGIFTPVRSGDNVYADGGLLNNLPVDVAQNMGAKLTIAVYLRTASFNAQQPLSSFSVLGQSLSVMIAANELKSMQMADVLVTVPLDKYSALDYNQAAEIIRLGYEAAEGKSAILSKLAVDDAAWKQYVDRREKRTLETPVPQFIEVTGTTPILANRIERRLNPDVGKPVNNVNLEDQFTRIAGTGRFASLSYSMTEKDGKPGLLVSTQEKAYSPPIVRPLINIDGTNYNEVLFSAGARITFLDWGSFGSELRNDIIVGSVYRLATEYYHPFSTATRWFIAPQVTLDTNKFYFYFDNHIDSQYRKRQFGGALDIGYTFHSVAEVRLGYQSAYQRYSPVIGDTVIYPVQSGRIGVTRLHYNLNLTDDPILPMRGMSVTFRGEWWDANTGTKKPFPLAELQSRLLFPLNQKSSAYLALSGGSTLGYESTGIPPFSLGGGLQLSAFGENELITNQYYLLQTGYIRRLAKLPPFLGDSISLITTYEAGKTFFLSNEPSVPMDGVVGIVIKTAIGPFEIAGAAGNGNDHRKIFFQLGRFF